MRNQWLSNEHRCVLGGRRWATAPPPPTQERHGWRSKSRDWTQGGVMLQENGSEPLPPKPDGVGYASVLISGYGLAQRLGRGHPPSSFTSGPDTRLVDRFLPGNKKAPQHVFADSLRCLVSLLLPRGGQYDQRIYYAQLYMRVWTSKGLYWWAV